MEQQDPDFLAFFTGRYVLCTSNAILSRRDHLQTRTKQQIEMDEQEGNDSAKSTDQCEGKTSLPFSGCSLVKSYNWHGTA